LQGQHIAQVAVVAFRPEVRIRRSVDRLHRDPHPVVQSQNRAFDDAIHTQFPAISRSGFFTPLYCITEVREITFRALIFARSAISASVILGYLVELAQQGMGFGTRVVQFNGSQGVNDPRGRCLPGR
jgi:hypothetical protein